MLAATMLGVASLGAGAPSPALSSPAALDAPVADDSLRVALDEVLRRSTAPVPVPGHLWRHVRALYGDARATLWLGSPRAASRAAALVAALRGAHREGVRLEPSLLATVDSAAASLAVGPDAGARARADVFLTAAFAAYGEVMLTGQRSPIALEADWHIDPNDVDVDSALARTLRADDPAAALERLLPQEEGYATLRDGLARYRAIAADGGWPVLRTTRTLRSGDPLPTGHTLRARLATEGYLDAARSAEETSGRYDGELPAAVARFQERHGLTIDSVLGPRTRRALNVAASERARQIAANMERYRWLPPEFASRAIVVNVPAFRLDAYDAGRRVLSMRVIVGAELEHRRTPIFSDTMRYVQFGPYWNVTRNIARREILPEVVADRAYLARNDFELVRGWGDDAAVVDPWTVSDADLFSGRYRVRQRPGPLNALGRVKFMFPNDYNVYLHDTPARELFDERVRAFSHGCVRVADPAALAEFVLARRAGWSPSRIRETLAAGERVRVTLADPVPVYLIYLTAFEQEGALAFRADRYRQDEVLMRALGEPPGAEDSASRLDALAGRLGLAA
jgi:murein L,D-transpeptidase YcbB/YkuD